MYDVLAPQKAKLLFHHGLGHIDVSVRQNVILTLVLSPVDGGYDDWSDWSKCSASCGGGIKSRTRNCTNPAPKFNGKDCSALGPDKESLPCNTEKCPSE